MGIVTNNLLLGEDGYQISRSVRLRSSASAYFNRTLTTPTNNLKWTWSAWVKRGTLAASNPLFYGGDGSSNNFGGITFRTDDTLQFAQVNGGTYNVQVYTTAVFRDPSAWYHIVVVYDSANATSADRVQIYVNGTRQTSLTYATGPFSQNTSSKINSAIAHYTGKLDFSGVYCDCYITENNFIDGQALTPSSFGETDSITGVWKPKKYAGTYGTNGFYLNFSDNSVPTSGSNVGIGKDFSGNGNYWNSNNISMLSGTTTTSFTSTGTTSWTAPAGVTSVNYLVVAGGGAGGTGGQANRGGGGGGAGGLRTGSLAVTPGSSYTVTVGAGGVGSTATGTTGQNGGNSVFSSITSTGGGGGRSGTSTGAGASGGSGGGAFGSGAGGSGTSGQGNSGGSDGNSPYYGGGGGGAGGAGQNGNGTVNSGGAGLAVTTGTTTSTYAVGGNGGSSTTATNGAANTGNGGSGSYSANAGGSGGSGIVVIWYGSAQTYDSFTDVPTLYADGGNGRGNYATLNPLDNGGNTVSSGNLVVTTSVGFDLIRSTMFVSSGKWYWEVTCDDCGEGFVGISAATEGLGTRGAETTNSATIRTTNGDLRTNATNTSYGSAVSDNSVMMFALDMDAGKFWAGKDGTWFNSGDPAAGTNAGKSSGLTVPVSPSIATYDNEDYTANFGQRPFSYTPPTGFKALNTQNLPDSTIKKGNAYFDISLYTGNGSTQTITNNGSMQPDMVWVKRRDSAAYYHDIIDSVRGVGRRIFPNDTGAEQYSATDYLTAFNSNGFSVGSNGDWNGSGAPYVGWQWKESVTAGFDIVTYTGNGSTQNISHSLGVAPKMIITKKRSAAERWCVYHTSTSNAYIYLNETFAADTANAALRFGNNSAVVQPTSSVFSIGSSNDVNASAGTYVAYLFADVAGFSKFGSYTGNGSSDGPFVYAGFRPRYVMVKRTDAISNWSIRDTSRDTVNTATAGLHANLSDAESTQAAIDMLSNGFKCRDAGGSATNASGGTYIYAAFAENPFKNSLAR